MFVNNFVIFLIFLFGLLLGLILSFIFHDIEHHKRLAGEFKFNDKGDKYLYTLQVDKPLDDLPKMDYMTFKVVHNSSQELQGL